MGRAASPARVRPRGRGERDPRRGACDAARLLPREPAEHLHRPAHAGHARRRAAQGSRAVGGLRDAGAMDISFVAGFGPITRDDSRGFWSDGGLGIPFEEIAPGYFGNDALGGVKAFALWPLS